jgi:hypothetical protein
MLIIFLLPVEIDVGHQQHCFHWGEERLPYAN